MSFHLTIRSRIYGGSAILVALSVVIAGFGIWQMLSVQQQIERLGKLSAQNTRVLQMGANVEQMRRATTAYRLELDAAKAEDFRSAYAKANDLLAQIVANSLSEERKRLYRQIQQHMTDVGRKFDTMVVSEKDTIEAKSGLFKLGDALTAATAKVADAVRAGGHEATAGHLESAILLVRVANWRFLATNDPQGVAVFKTSVEKAGIALADLQEAGLANNVLLLIDPVKKSLNGYAAGFNAASASILKSNKIYTEDVRPLFEEVQKLADTTQESISKGYFATQTETEMGISTTITTAGSVAAVGFLVGGLIAFILSRSLINPIAGMTGAMSKLAAGDTRIEIPSQDAKDEMGEMARTVQIFKTNAIEVEGLRLEQQATEQRSAEQRKADMHRLAADFEGAVGEIIETVSASSTELEASAGVLTATAERSQKLTTMVAVASEEASSNVQSVASATEEMASSVNEISRQVQESATIASHAVDQARKTNDRVSELAQAAARIGDVVELINSIAGQTNLLALNATIEAARAGEAGRGFAVVASEVKALAEQTAKATGEISMQISGIQAATQESVDAIKEIGNTIGRMSEIASTIASAVEEQGAATQEISRNVQQAAQGTSQVTSNIADVQRGASETGSASSQVLSAAQSLSTESNRLKLEVGKFLNTVRAA